jgi:hypothetical protein
MASLAPVFDYQPLDNTGNIVPGGKLWTYESGTTTPKTTYKDQAGGVSHTNPIVLGASGRVPGGALWLGTGEYTFKLTDASDVELWTRNDIAGIDATLRDELDSTASAATGTGAVKHSATVSYTDPDSLGYWINLRSARSDAEILASVTPTNYQFDEGDIRRYGAVLDGVTSDSAALDKLYSVIKYGGHGYVPPKKMMLTTQSTLEIDNSGTVGRRYGNIILEGYGCEVYTSGAICALDVRYGFTPMGVTVRGFKINHRGNASATYGVRLRNTTHALVEDVSVEAHGVGGSYAAFALLQDDPADNATANNWATLRGCNVRKRAGADPGDVPICLLLEGAQNATLIEDCSFGMTTGSTSIGIDVRPPSGQPWMPNAVMIRDNAFEGLGTAYRETTGTNAGTAIWATGVRLLGNRMESMTSGFMQFVSGTGATVTDPSYPLIARDNYRTVGSGGTQIDLTNAYGLLVFAQDQSNFGGETQYIVGTAVGPQFMMQAGNFRVSNFSGASSYSIAHLQLGTIHYWTSSAPKTYRKTSAPASETDGTVVGTDT